MIDLIMSAVADTVADWTPAPAPTPTGIDAWIKDTVASNQDYVRMDVISGGQRRRA